MCVEVRCLDAENYYKTVVSYSSDLTTIEGKIGNQSYQFKIDSKLPSMDFVEAMQQNNKKFKSKFLNKETAAISVWTTPKRTKTYPLARVYDTLSYDGTKITIIPVIVDYGKHGERGKIQPNTVDWMTSIGVYLILGVYVDAEKGKVGRLAKNAGIKTKSSEGKPKFAEGQKFDLKYLQKQIEKIIENKPNIKKWNENQLTTIPNLLENGITHYKRLGKKLDVPLSDFSRLEKKVELWKNDPDQFLADHEKLSKGAQNRETKTGHKLEDVPGEKGKINIDFGESRKLYLTSDSMELDKDKCLVTLLEGKNASSGKLPSENDIKEALIKLMIFKNSDFYFEGKKLEKKLVCYLTGQYDNVEEEFRVKFQSLIDECNANNIELKLNDKIIR